MLTGGGAVRSHDPPSREDGADDSQRQSRAPGAGNDWPDFDLQQETSSSEEEEEESIMKN